MASIRLSPPDPFNLKRPDEWECWKRRFEQFRVASGLSEESDERQVSTLLYCLGYLRLRMSRPKNGRSTKTWLGNWMDSSKFGEM